MSGLGGRQSKNLMTQNAGKLFLPSVRSCLSGQGGRQSKSLTAQSADMVSPQCEFLCDWSGGQT